MNSVPKDVIGRVYIEYGELLIKIHSLEKFLSVTEFDDIELLEIQLDAMKSYAEVLKVRISKF